MPSIPNSGYDGIFHSLDHTNTGNEALTSPGALPFLSHMSIFADGHATLETRSLGDTNATIVMANHQRFTIRVIATTCSSISLASALLAIYWFYMIRRNFRRDLVLLLILGGSWKSLWFLIFSGVTFKHGDIPSSSPFCQASGYLLLVGFESCGECTLGAHESWRAAWLTIPRCRHPLHEHAHVPPNLPSRERYAGPRRPILRPQIRLCNLVLASAHPR
jgi:hypothetical protein